MQRRVDVFVVHHQQAVAIRCVGEREKVHAVVVVAGLLELSLPVIAGIRVPRWRVGQHGVAPRKEGARAVARRDLHAVEFRVELGRNPAEADQRIRLYGATTGAQRAAEKAQRGEAHAAPEQVAPTLIDQLPERGISAGVDGLIVQGGKVGVEILKVLFHSLARLANGSAAHHWMR